MTATLQEMFAKIAQTIILGLFFGTQDPAKKIHKN